MQIKDCSAVFIINSSLLQESQYLTRAWSLVFKSVLKRSRTKPSSKYTSLKWFA